MASFGSNTPNFPKLPVPKLEDTLRKYLRSLKPMVDSNEWSRAIQVVRQFQESELARKLQDYVERRRQEKENWLNEWYLCMRYLDNRLPTALCSSPGQMLPLEHFENENARLSYTARLIIAATTYKMVIDRGELPDNTKRDMSQYSKMFGACRIPHPSRDKIKFHPHSEHIIIAFRNQFFKLKLFHNSQLIGERQLLKHLHSITSQPLEPGIPIGILTTEQRDKWAQTYEELTKENEKQINDIETCLFLVCLDETSDAKVNRLTKAGMHLLHGGGSKQNGSNRWYDKTLQFVIGSDGTVGLIYEHSVCDGQPIANMVEYLNHLMLDMKCNAASIFRQTQRDEACSDVSDEGPSKLIFRLTESIRSDIREAEGNFNESVNNSDIEWFKFDSFGKDFIKSVQLSPDSFVQIAIQLSFYRMHGLSSNIYEAVSTSKFAKGRVESLRSFSEEAFTFIRIALDQIKGNDEKSAALRLAVNTHKRDSLEAGEGYGTERHFMGLKAAAEELNLPVPSLHCDSTYIKSITSRVSTSQVATNCDSLTGFGTIPTDLYACCYNIRPSDINISIFSFKSNLLTTSAGMKDAIISSLCDMRDILIQCNN
uniref:Choline/carnitine acyltransferase domain-containing protein n=4 Tax=Photinus pyralis TaxID=7054 RepID=A0A1Y1JZM6_PHOPY